MTITERFLTKEEIKILTEKGWHITEFPADPSVSSNKKRIHYDDTSEITDEEIIEQFNEELNNEDYVYIEYIYTTNAIPEFDHLSVGINLYENSSDLINSLKTLIDNNGFKPKKLAEGFMEGYEFYDEVPYSNPQEHIYQETLKGFTTIYIAFKELYKELTSEEL